MCIRDSSGTELLQFAVAGMLSAMKESTLIFAPHFNSYRRLRPDAHAPTAICWGYENRTTAIRIPGGAPQARRIEHRVAGADANPYLVLAAILGAALLGMEEKLLPPDQTKGNAYDAGAEVLPGHWADAIKAFDSGSRVEKIYPAQLKDVFAQIKNQEMSEFLDKVSAFETKSYADLV